jgi:hypothetical protein
LKEEAKSSTGRCPQGFEKQLYYLVAFKFWFHHL